MRANKIVILVVFFFTSVSCSNINSFQRYDCNRFAFKGEPRWIQISLDKNKAYEFTLEIEKIYANPSTLSFLTNEDKKRKYFWYRSEEGSYMACVSEYSSWRRTQNAGKAGCSADRFIIEEIRGAINIENPEGLICT